MFWRRPQTASRAQLPAGERVYAIGDLHGEAVLFERMLARILGDSADREPARTTLVLLGDVIDRGAHAARLLSALAGLEDPRLVILKGNHEEALVECYRGDEEALGFWLRFGGRSTLAGLGLAEQDIDAQNEAGLLAMLRAAIDPAIIDWLDGLPLSWSLGDYFFAHAGIRPGVALDQQTSEDLMWIREPFLSSRADHGKVIVHGHTIEDGMPTLGANRIGLDTGAHEHGNLTALGLEDGEQWLLQVTAAVPAAEPPTIAVPDYRPLRALSI